MERAGASGAHADVRLDRRSDSRRRVQRAQGRLAGEQVRASESRWIAGIARDRRRRRDGEPGRRTIPEGDALPLGIRLDGGGLERDRARDRGARRREKPRARVGEVLEQAGIEAEAADLVGHDDVGLLRQVDVGR